MDDDDLMVISSEDEKIFAKLDEDFDYSLALMLQEQLNEEEESRKDKHSKTEKEVKVLNSERQSLSVVDPEWETIDPNPDIHQLFIQFNKEFFWSVLESVEVRWSPRMTLCAGVCAYEGRGGLCSVRLSQPLLKFRPRSDLVETLLHEMIHAYLFVTQNNKDHDGHGPEFLKHMSRINKQTGAKISVYHSFHDEVDHQRQHWWKCNGPCQHRKPYFGILKRAINRAPSPKDPWWADHQRTCGGQYIKIKEPEKKKPQNSKHATPEGNSNRNAKDIRKFFTPSHASNSATSSTAQNVDAIVANASMGARVMNIDSLKDPKKSNGFVPFSGKGNVLGNGVNASASVGSNLLRKTHIDRNVNLTKEKLPLRSPISNAGSYQGTMNKFKSPGTSSHSHFKGITSTGILSAGSSSRTVVLNKTPKTKHKPSEMPQVKRDSKLQNSTTAFKSSNVSEKHKNLDDFFSSSKAGNLKSPVSRDASPKRRAIVVFSSSDSDDENMHAGKVVKKTCNDTAGRMLSDAEDSVSCPVCNLLIKQQEINDHLDMCLKH